MAKKAEKTSRSSNKSESIRQYMQENPDAGPTAVADALNAREGWKISPAYVSTIKNKVKETGGRRRRRRRRGRPRAGAVAGTSSGSRSLNERALLQAKQFAKESGGISQAKAALDLLSRLQS
jgi:hypothetical protein